MDDFDLEGLEPVHWVTCEVIKECGYHDTHNVGEIISVDRKHLDEMIGLGYVRVVGSDD